MQLQANSGGIALITGPTSGIGKAFAHLLASKGYDQVLVARDKARLDELAVDLTNKYRVNCEVIVADLATESGAHHAAKRCADESKPIAVLVNNAGFGIKTSFEKTPIAQEEAMLNVLVRAPMLLTHAALPVMRKKGRGHLVHIGSVAAWITSGTYSAAKAWLTTFSESLSVALAGTGVTSTVVAPGFVRTEFQQRAGMKPQEVPNWMWLSARLVAQQAWQDVLAGKTVSVPSLQYKVLSTLTRGLPRPLVRRVSKDVMR
jgi:short-subunit dehydrogenase